MLLICIYRGLDRKLKAQPHVGVQFIATEALCSCSRHALSAQQTPNSRHGMLIPAWPWRQPRSNDLAATAGHSSAQFLPCD
jgi:hypothetical protein